MTMDEFFTALEQCEAIIDDAAFTHAVMKLVRADLSWYFEEHITGSARWKAFVHRNAKRVLLLSQEVRTEISNRVNTELSKGKL